MMTNIEFWFIPLDILMIICTILVIILFTIFLLAIALSKKCHTVPIMFVANSCLAGFVHSINFLGMAVFSFHNDLKRIQYQDSFCIVRGYLGYTVCAIQNYSFLIQAIYRYISVFYPDRRFCQSANFQVVLICLTWIFGFVHSM